MLELTLKENSKLFIPIVKTIGNIVTGTDEHTELVISNRE
jgi:hypothetical protein